VTNSNAVAFMAGTFRALARYSARTARLFPIMSFHSHHDFVARGSPAEPNKVPIRFDRLGLKLGLSFLVLVSLAASAWAAGGEGKGSEAVLVAEILLLIFAGGLLGELMLRIGQPAVMGQLLAGLLLGPSVLGALWPDAYHTLFPSAAAQKSMIEGIAQFGILILLLLAGMETELALVRGVRRAAVSASIGGIAVPFACGFALGQFLPEQLLPAPEQRLITSLFLGTALSISSVKIVATVIREMGFLRRNVGQVILASAIVDDTIGWIIIAITLSLAAHGSLDWVSLAQGVVGTALFLVASFTLGRRVVARIIRWTNDNFRGEAPVIATIIFIMGTFALITHVIGVHSVLGAFVAGILVGESPILTRRIDEQLRGLVAGLFMPVFFGLAGLSADLTILQSGELTLLTLLLVLIATIGKTGGAFVGGYFGGLTRKESVALATGMNARGSTEVIVASIGLSMGVLSQSLFTMIVAMAVMTTLAMPPSLRWALKRLPIREEEQRRLDREEFEAKGFVSNLERVLVAVDDSPNGLFAARIAGLVAGSRGMPVTVVKPPTSGRSAAKPENEKDEAVETLTRSAEAAVAVKEDAGADVERVEGKPDRSLEEIIEEEGRKGYDLLVIGVEPAMAPTGGFHDNVSRIARLFDGSLVVVAARGQHDRDPQGARINILTPVTGNEVSRRGAELAINLAKAAKAPTTVLSVLAPGARTERERLGAARRDAAEVVKEIKAIAEFHETPIKSALRTDISAEDAILRHARLGRHNLIVLGVSRRPGDTLSFGELATALLESSDRSLVFVAPSASGRAREGGGTARTAPAQATT
jgi:Kef-type K+ transport system membrane component KefB/nucleotide-binding universal stress UspA family protein